MPMYLILHFWLMFTFYIKIGASTGIGSATAIKFAKQGASLVIHGRNEDGLNNTIQECPNESRNSVS